jgi:hypothetical protein
MTLAEFIAELRRRRVLRVAAACVIGAWVAVQREATATTRAAWVIAAAGMLATTACGVALSEPTSRSDAARDGRELPLPSRVVAGTQWRSQPALGHEADAVRRNLRPGDSLTFRDLTMTVSDVEVPASGSRTAQLRLRAHGVAGSRSAGQGTAFAWNGYRIAVVAIPAPDELGAGFVAIEIATLASLPPHIASSTEAGGADMRLRVPHRITRITLHHTGSAEPLRPGDDPVQRLRGLQSWGASDRNWWDLPYHFLIDLDGNVYQGRDWRFMGETNTGYDPAGHFLISVIGNYELQQPNAAQLDAIADMMAWAIRNFDVPLDRIGGHYDYATTSCPGQHLRPLLEDGTFRRMVERRI